MIDERIRKLFPFALTRARERLVLVGCDGLAPASVRLDVPRGIAGVVVTDPPDPLETVVIWRTDDPSPANRAFREAAQRAFAGATAHTESV